MKKQNKKTNVSHCYWPNCYFKHRYQSRITQLLPPKAIVIFTLKCPPDWNGRGREVAAEE